MRALLVAVLAFLAVATPSFAGTEGPATTTASVPAPEAYSTTETPIAVLIADPAARAVLQKYMPSLIASAQNPAVAYAPIKAFQSFAGPMLSDKLLADIDRDLSKLTPQPNSLQLPIRPINIDETRAGTYTLPDPLILSDGTPVRDAKTWWKKRRPEILQLFETQQFGRAPGRPTEESFDVFDKGTAAFDGKAIRKQVIIHLSKDPAAPQIQLVEYIPAAAKKRVPMLLAIGFAANSSTFADPGIRQDMVNDPKTGKKIPAPANPMGKMDITPFLNAGIGVASFYYGDVEPDSPEGYPYGIRAFYTHGKPLAPDEWGAIAAWAWALSRAQDYLETDKTVDAKSVALFGASRLGKTVLWAGARDRRFAAVTACCSGEGGAALSHRNFGQTIAEILMEEPHQFAGNYHKYADKENTLPMDAHMLLSLIAPRPVFLQTGDMDYWSDPKGEFLSAVAAGPVYRLLGKQDLGTTAWPPSGPILNDIGYFMHKGGHGMVPGDWDVYVDFLKRHLHQGN
jgi:hypothetical protein